MQALERLKLKRPAGPCLPCFALERSAASIAPHDELAMAASTATMTGVREEFTCNACGQRMVRFLATQTTPRPADVWRYERAAQRAAAVATNPPALSAATSISGPPQPSSEAGDAFDKDTAWLDS